MPIEVNRTEVLSLMQELPADHFLQSRLADELMALMEKVQPARSADHLRAAFSDATSTPEVIDRRLVVKLRENEFTEPTLEEIYDNDGVVPLTQCKHQTYGYQCPKKTKDEYCEDHLGQLCVHKIGDNGDTRCGRQSDHGCPTELQFVCGAPCCEIHSNCGNHNRSFGMGY